MRLRAGRRPVAVAAIVLPAAALALEDAATGLKITPPPPFVAQRVDGDRGVDVRVRITSTTGRPASVNDETGAVCMVNFIRRRSPEPTSRETLNAMVADPRWQRMAKDAMAQQAFDIQRSELFSLQGYRGIEMQGQLKNNPRARETLAFVSRISSVKGSTIMTCTTRSADFDEALPQFRAIRAAITLPE